MKNMTTKYKLVVSDLDGTLLSNFHVPTTGRTIQSTKNILKEIGTYNEENEYSILFNGCVIIENKNNKVLFFKGIDFEISNKLFEIGKKYDVMLLVYSIDNCYVWKSYEKEIERQKSYEELLTFMDDLNINFIKEKNIQITKIVFVNEDHNYLLKIKEELDKIFGNEISISTSANMYLEINAKNVNKGNALEWLANYLKIDMKETIAIGDNSNDIFMIEKAGIGVCVKNGIDILKNKANYVTEKTNDEGAVKEVLDKFVLGE